MSKSLKEKFQVLLDEGHSVVLRDEMVALVGNSKARMKDFMYFFFHDSLRYNQRSSWALGEIGRSNPKLLEPYYNDMLESLKNPKHDAVVRNILKIFETADIPEEMEGPLCDFCFTCLHNPNRAIAIRAYAMTVLHKIVKPYPDLQGELIAVIEEYLPLGTAAYKVRARRVLADLRK